MKSTRAERPLDAIVVGSGFAGAVTARRLTEAGLQICVLERGRRYERGDLPVLPEFQLPDRGRVRPDFSSAFWQTGHGLWDLRDLGDVLVAQAAGYGGGSLIYANVHLRAPPAVFARGWPAPYQRAQLDPYYDVAAYALGVEPMPEALAAELPKARRFRELDRPGLRVFRPPLAVHFGGDEKREPCDLGGLCCFGCPRHAKNTLDLNYLRLAEEAGAEIRTSAEVVSIEREGAGAEGRPVWRVEYVDTWDSARNRHALCAPNVFLCAGAVNTTELLLRMSAEGRLRCAGEGLGARYYPNADELAAVFDCDDLHEMDRGPTITSCGLYDREPDDGDPDARWTLGFRDGAFEPPVGSEIRSDSGAEGVLAGRAALISGGWSGLDADARGELVLARVRGAFRKDDRLQCDDRPFAVASSGAEKSRHWLLVQDGGLPSALEPLLGAFRSPLWLHRNAFREGPAPEHASIAQRIGYGALPFDNPADVLAGMTRGALGTRLSLAHDVSELGLALLRGGRALHERPELAHLLPAQLERALERVRRQILDDVGTASEEVVSEFLETAAKRLEERFDLEEVLASIPIARRADLSGLEKQHLPARALRLGVQGVWGSQAGLAREIARRLLALALPQRDEIGKRVSHLVRWALDYRIGNGRGAMLLSMGRDSAPGRLELATPPGPTIGSAVTGRQSRAVGTLVGATPGDDAPCSAQAAPRILILAKLAGRFVEGEPVEADGCYIGVAAAEDVAVAAEAALPEESAAAAALGLRALRVRASPPAPPPHPLAFRSDANRGGALAAPETAPAAPGVARALRARLPDGLATTERAAQECVLRDIAKHWGGELRTDPLHAFLDRRITVHSQGGCAMGDVAEGAVSDADGRVHGCDGLFVMDAAAFPRPVGVNPSATIAAIAEYKVERFVRAWLGDSEWASADRAEAEAWIAQPSADGTPRREALDPIAALEREGDAGASPAPGERPIGIAFEEVMIGSHYALPAGGEELWIESDLQVEIDDLAAFLEWHRRGRPQPARIVSGTVTLDGLPDDRVLRVVPGRCTLQLFSTAPEAVGREWRQLRYDLELEGDIGRRYRLEGWKDIRDDAHFDVWEDATTLRFQLHDLARSNAGPFRQGILRLPASKFFEVQLPSFRATNTADPLRQSWALAAFGKFFFGNLVDVYLPELDRLGEVLRNVVNRSHG